jgi:hypothetical protein
VADRRLELWGELAEHAAGRSARVSVVDICAVAAASADLTGAWVAAARDEEPAFLVCATDPVGEELAELQLTLGEGPCHDVLALAAPALGSDLADDDSGRRWPAFTSEARELGAGAVFAFPLIVGAIRAGVLGGYRRSAGRLTSGQLGDLLILADTATMLLLDSLADGVSDGVGPWLNGQSPDLALHRAEIDQATGMLTVQLGVDIAEALARLRAYAYSQDRRLAEVARDIVARRLRLHPDPHPEEG